MERSQSSQESGTSEDLEEASCDCRAESEEKGALEGGPTFSSDGRFCWEGMGWG